MSSSSDPLEQPRGRLKPKTKTLWWAYAIAPAVAPIVFAITVFVSGSIWLQLNPDFMGTPVGVVIVPILALTVGMLASYLVAGVIGMPIAFFLRQREILNGYTILGAAFLGTIFFIGLSSTLIYVMASPTRQPLDAFLVSTLVMALAISPFILLSATTFWWIVSRDKRQLSLRSMVLIMTGFAVLSAVLVAFFR